MNDVAAPRKVLLDCDPGIDDALAIAFACGDPGLDLRAVTTVGGNVPLAQTTINALRVLELSGRPDVPVAAGSPGPLLQPLADARLVHGETGLGEARLPAPGRPPVATHAIDLMNEMVSAAPGEITLIATGPLTNVALALRRYPGLAGQVADFVIMGGSAGRGNVTPAAEFNIATDPEAAAIVFAAGWRVTMTGLDVTLQTRTDGAVWERMRGLGRLGRDLLLPALGGYRAAETVPGHDGPSGDTGEPGHGDPPGGAAGSGGLARGPAVHDVCALALVAEPGLFGCQPARVEVETAGRWTAGMTVTDFQVPPGRCNARVAMSIDVPRFWDTVFAAWSRLPAAQQRGVGQSR